MITVTARAKERLKRSLSTLVAAPGTSLRLEAAGPGAFGLIPDTPRPGDQVIEQDGVTVLLIRPRLAEQLNGWSIDCAGSGTECELLMTRPHARQAWTGS